MSPKHNFKDMSLGELRQYVLSHRDDQDAWREFAERKRPHAIYFDTDVPLSIQKERLQALLQGDH